MAFTFDCCDLFTLCLSLMKNNYESALADQILNTYRIPVVSPAKHLLRRGARRNGCIHGLDKDMYYPIYYRLYSLSVFLLAKSLQLILEIGATYRLISYLLPDNWLICRLRAQCMISINSINSGSLWQRVCRYFLQNNAGSTLIISNITSNNCLIHARP